MFTPVRITADVPCPAHLLPAPPDLGPSKPAPADAERIEIVLPDGTCVRVGAGVGLATLRRVMAAVRR